MIPEADLKILRQLEYNLKIDRERRTNEERRENNVDTIECAETT